MNGIHNLGKKLFPICRSITGNGVRETLKIIKKHLPKLKIHEIKSGTKVFDWKVPSEWNIKDAYVLDKFGQKIINFKKNNLHLVGYSIPYEGLLSKKKLEGKLTFLKDKPDAIPYKTTYYKKDWGFCLSYNQFKKFKDKYYYVKIESKLELIVFNKGLLLLSDN